MSRKQSSAGLRLFWALLWVGFGGPAVGSVVALVSGGHWPPAESDSGPLRLGMVIGFGSFAAAFALATIGSILARRAGHPRFDVGLLLLQVGLTISAAAIVPIVAILPTEPGHSPVPLLLQLPLYCGLGLLVLGLVWSMTPALREGVRRRDPLPFLALVLLAGLFIILRSRS
ncbi:MAG TPA: hypothetical protein VFY18_01230 [Candidatus Limnocylindrales bacterium]|nr:hypothetical protein [Candidatus Limnocylindrales bacterium]